MAAVGDVIYGKLNLPVNGFYTQAGAPVPLGNGLSAGQGPIQAMYVVDAVDGSGNPTAIRELDGAGVGPGSSSTSLAVNEGVWVGSYVNSAVTAASATSQEIFPTVPNGNTRIGLVIQNLNGTNPVFINFGANATSGAGSIRIAPNSEFRLMIRNDVIPQANVTLIGSASAEVITAKQILA